MTDRSRTIRLLAALMVVVLVASAAAINAFDATETRFLATSLLALVAVAVLFPPFASAGAVITVLGMLAIGAVQVGLAIDSGSAAEGVYLTRAALSAACVLAVSTLGGTLNTQLRRLREELARQESTIEVLTTRDQTTGALKEDQIRRQLAEEISRGRRYGYPISILSLAEEAAEGLSEADEEDLAGAARAVQSRLRPMDSLGQHGDRAFTIMLPHTPLDGAQVVATKIIDTVREATGINMQAGVAEFPEDAATAEDLMNEADQALGFARLASLKVASRKLLV
ncbi:MAG: diguanylate cyclase [Chloroflexi bacterium]|nr:diguanylate cyclase [Chloroflexota bacterium]